ncbi:MAG TPA: succinate dehydrogenase, hydrophobic membrane anchor protein [Candidatus Azoamicus sp. OHIO2]
MLSNSGWRSGLRDWVVQRFTGLYIFFYSLFIICYLIIFKFEYCTLSLLFQSFFFKIFTILFVFSLVMHVSLGMSIILTDYIKQTFLRIVLDFMINVILLSYVFCVIQILWSFK